MKFDTNPGCMFLIWCCRNYLLSFFLWKNVACLKHCIPEGNWKILEGFPEGEPEGKSQYAKHCIPEGNRKIPEGYPEEILEGKVVFFTLFYIFSCLTWLGSPSKVLTQVLKGSESRAKHLRREPGGTIRLHKRNRTGLPMIPEGKRKATGRHIYRKVWFESQGPFGDFERALANTSPPGAQSESRGVEFRVSHYVSICLFNAAQKGGVKWFTFLCFFVQLLKEKSKKKEGSCENTESRKATGRSRKVTRKESRKDNFGN